MPSTPMRKGRRCWPVRFIAQLPEITAAFRKNGRIIRILGNRDADLLLYFCRRYIVIRPTVTFSVLGSKTQNDLFGLFASLRDVHPAKNRLPICTFPIFGVSTCKYRPGEMHIPPSKTRNVQVFNAFSTSSLEGDSAVPGKGKEGTGTTEAVGATPVA